MLYLVKKTIKSATCGFFHIMNPNNNGSFGAAIGGDPLQEAISRRTGQAGATSAVSPASATFNPTTQLPPTQPQQTPQMQPQGATATPQGQPTIPFDATEAQIIIKALSKRLEAGSKYNGGGLV